MKTEKTNISLPELSTLVRDVQSIVENGLQKAYRDANATTVITYWRVGRRIVEEEQHGEVRAEYGKGLINLLSKEMTAIYPKGYSPRDLRNYRQLYLCFNDLEIWYTRVPNLNWSHYRTLLHVVNDDARYWYVQEASREMWSVRTLARNVGSQYYHRLLQSPKKETVVAEMLQLTAPLKDDARSFLKDPVVAEFLQLPSNNDFTETQLEKAIIAHLKSFLLELGRGFAFMSEQYHVATDAGDLNDMKADRESFRKLGLTFEEKAFYDILIALRDKNNFEYGEDKIVDGVVVNDKCKSLARKIKEIVDAKSSFADWLNNQRVREQLKQDIKICLVKNGYPPKYTPEVFREVMDQVENFKENYEATPLKLANVEDDRDVRNLIFNRLQMDIDINNGDLQREVIELYGERYPDMSLNDWRLIIEDYTPMVREASRPKAKVISMESQQYGMAAEEDVTGELHPTSESCVKIWWFQKKTVYLHPKYRLTESKQL